MCRWGQEHQDVSLWRQALNSLCPFVYEWMSSHVQDNRAPKNVGRSAVPGREEAVNSPYVACRDHFSPLTGEMGGRTGQRWDSSRVTDADGVSFGPDPERGVVLCGLGQEDQVVEGNARVMGPRSESEDGLRPGSRDAPLLRFSVVFVLSRLLWVMSVWGGTSDVGRGERGLVWPSSGSQSTGGVVVFVDDRRGLDPAGGQEANGDCITPERWSDERPGLPSWSESLISAVRQQRKIRK